eukprot:gnl/MRDRNA2_/MRDRNA2_276332_c0_seq1.p1 gnl/MRDRNA2_/MRDRNA2_276332_c0~~gnl/MRDRNA2_/MRDRNA2_276332_c0_seq1.p1  ORF type:complete len:117 (-),score=9.26 gnl/MRDRNA2_/MRDRNA2_276332_c0_seq1:396-746(-)
MRAKLKDFSGQRDVLLQTGLDQFVHHPWVFLPLFYGLKEFIEGGCMENAYKKYRANLWTDCCVCWVMWIPAHIFNFSFCPLWLRIPWITGTSFAFSAVMSFMRGAPQVLVEGREHE